MSSAIERSVSNEKDQRAYLHDENAHPTPVAQIDPELEKRIVRKMDKRIVPLVSGMYLLSFLDRSNIGNAKTAGMEEGLHLSGDRYDWLLTIFYIAYILGQCQGFMWKLMRPRTWGAFVVLWWGIIATCQAAVQSYKGELALRFFLGWSEAGFGPSIPYLLSFFYLRHEIGSRIGVFLSCAPLATTFAGALAYGITSGHSKLANWRLLFLVEGLPTILMAPVVFFLLADSPVHLSGLTEEEKNVAKSRGVRQVGDVERVGGIDFKDVGRALLDLKAWFTALMYFSCNVSFSSLPVFLPTILEEMGYTSINAQGLTAPPYFLAFLVTISSTILADKIQQRGLVIFVLSLVGGIGYIVCATVEQQGVRYFSVFLAAAGVFPAIANILPWVLNNQGSDTRRGMGIIILNLIGQCGPILGTRIYPESQGPRYVQGLSICAAFMFFNAVLALSLRTLLAWKNKKLDQKYGTSTRPRVDQESTGDKKVALIAQENYGEHFRFIL
ncbi:putative mfs [Phaeomoniella chlamydospora]|uniref:Putative mfs n=1 Tax=Phaeomoniella chlamydospora TaxID=158046 RepID=A0A0G2E367_PHACM|nr:putative mfs [Phaeomoniella chlamydospora]